MIMPKTFVRGDARKALSLIPDGHVDLIVTDPPYRVITGGLNTHNAPGGIFKHHKGQHFEHNSTAFEDYMPELFRVLTSPGHMWMFVNFINMQRAMTAIEQAGFKIHNLFVWRKNTMNPNRWGMKNCEYIILARKGPARALYTPSLPTVIDADSVKNRIHPTQKPTDLLRKLVEASSLPGQIVMDPFCGSGSTAYSCDDRQFFCIDIDPNMVRLAAERGKK